MHKIGHPLQLNGAVMIFITNSIVLPLSLPIPFSFLCFDLLAYFTLGLVDSPVEYIGSDPFTPHTRQAYIASMRGRFSCPRMRDARIIFRRDGLQKYPKNQDII